MNWRERIAREMPSPAGDWSRDTEVLDELAAHAADRFDELRRGGRTEAEAIDLVMADVRSAAEQAAARRGDWRDPAAPPAWRWLWIGFRQDVGYALRMLRRAPAFSSASVLTLALAIGAVTAIFTVVEGVLLRSLPYPDADRLVFVWESSPQGADRNVVSAGSYLDWRDRNTVFERLGAFSQVFDVVLTGAGDPRPATAVAYTRDALLAVGVQPTAGRLFSDEEAAPGGPAVALLGHGLWRSGFGSDPAVIGRRVAINGAGYEIIGVLPAETVLPGPEVSFVLPRRFAEIDRAQRTAHNHNVVGRLRAGVSVEAAQASMAALVAAMTAEHPKDLTGWGVLVTPVHADIVRTVRPLIAVVMTVVVIVLLIACANLANLQLARASGRQAELAIRAAIGAGRRRLLTQLLHESAVLAVLGGLLGTAVAFGLVRLLVAAAPADIPFLDAVTINGRVLAVAALTTIGCAVLVGLLPALQMSRADLRPLLHGGRTASDARQVRTRLGLVTLQIAMAVVLLVGAGLMVRSFQKLNAVEYGFDPEHLLTVELDLPGARYPDLAAHERFYRTLVEQVEALPGVVAAAGTTGVPGLGTGMTFSFAIEGRPAANPTGREDPEPLQAVTPGYFAVMRLPLVEGRPFTTADRGDGLPVAIVNAALKRRHWPETSPIGQRISFRPGETPWLTIVGVAGEAREAGLDANAPPTIYVPFAQRAPQWGWMTWQTLVVRGSSDPTALIGGIRGVVRGMDPDLALLDVRTVRQIYSENSARRRFAMSLLVGFAALALGLGAVGVYGVLSVGVAERQREIGVRLALGATAADVLRAVARSVAWCLVLGVAIGLGAAMAASRFLEALLFEVAPTDPATLAAVVGVLAVIALFAAWLPVRRALGLDPVQVLRD